MRSLTPELLAEITRRILSVSDPEQIIMFGSYARGDFNVNSDLDLLVIEDVEFLRQESVRLRQALRGLLFPIDVVVATPEQVERYRHSIGLIYRSALNEGKVLYDRSAAS
jgi:predicted nucleotidyltransferase